MLFLKNPQNKNLLFGIWLVRQPKYHEFEAVLRGSSHKKNVLYFYDVWICCECVTSINNHSDSDLSLPLSQ